MVSTLTDAAMPAPQMHRVGVVTCVVVEATDAASTLGEVAEETLVREGAVVVMPAGVGLLGAFQRVTDAVQAALILRTNHPSSRIALCTGETGAHGEFSSVADKARRLVSDADAGSTLLSKLAGVLAMDHLPRDRALHERSADGVRGFYYELLDARPFANSA